MKTIATLALLAFTAAHAAAHPAGSAQPVCTEIALDGEGNDMTGKPRTEPDQVIYRQVISEERGDSLGFYTTNDDQDRTWVLLRDVLCGVIDPFAPVVEPGQPAPPCDPRVWYGCMDVGIYVIDEK